MLSILSDIMLIESVMLLFIILVDDFERHEATIALTLVTYLDRVIYLNKKIIFYILVFIVINFAY